MKQANWRRILEREDPGSICGNERQWVRESHPLVLDTLCGEQRGSQLAPRNQKETRSVWRRHPVFSHESDLEMQNLGSVAYCDGYQQDSRAGKVIGVVKALPNCVAPPFSVGIQGRLGMSSATVNFESMMYAVYLCIKPEFLRKL